MKSKDIAAKNFWKDNRRFADLFNAVLFEGEKVIDPDLLKERNSDVSASVSIGKKMEHVKKYEDVTKYYDGMELSILGIENQGLIHYGMPLRDRLYDDLDFLAEARALRKEHIAAQNLFDPEEFLSGMRKGDKLSFSFRIVLYYGETPWDGPRRLSDLVNIPKRFRPYFQDYEILLVDIAHCERPFPFMERSVISLMRDLPLVYQSRWEELRDSIWEKETADVIGSLTSSQEFQRALEKSKNEKGGLVVCEAIKKLEEASMEKGSLITLGKLVISKKSKGKTMAEIVEALEESEEVLAMAERVAREELSKVTK